MKQYIDKTALVAEIERRLKALNNDRDFNYLQIKEIEALLSSIDTLEVKEEPVSVDLANAAIEYCGGNKGSDARVRAAFVVGAKWQEEQSIRAVEIAREEVIEKAQDWIADTFKYDGSEDFNGGADDAMSMLLDEFTKYMEE